MAGESLTVQDVAAQMYEECRAHLHLYDSPTGIRVPPVENPEYHVIYWPAWTDANGDHDERLSVSMGPIGDPGTMYHIMPGDGIIVNRAEHATPLRDEPGSGVMYDRSDDRPLEDVSEASLVLGLIRAAHNMRRLNPPQPPEDFYY